MTSLKPPPKPLLLKKPLPAPKVKASPPATLGTAASTAETGTAEGVKAKPATPGSGKLPLPAAKKGPSLKIAKAPAAVAAAEAGDVVSKQKQPPGAKVSGADLQNQNVTPAEGKAGNLKAGFGKGKAATPEAAGREKAITTVGKGGEKEAAAGSEGKAAAPATAPAAGKKGDGSAAAAAKASGGEEKTPAAAKGKAAAAGQSDKVAAPAAAKGEAGKGAGEAGGGGKGASVKERAGALAPGKLGAAAAPRKSLQELLSKDAPKTAAVGGVAADDPVAVATQQLLQYYDKSQEMLTQQQQYYVDAEKQQLLQQQELAMTQEPSADQVARLRRSAGIQVEDAALLTAIKNVCKREIGRRRLREYMLQHRKDKREDLLQGKLSAEAVGADLSKKHVKLLNAREWSALVQEFKAEATALEASLEKLKKENKENYEQLMATDFYRDAAKLQQQPQVATLLQQLLASPGASFRTTSLLELLIDEIEFAHALKDVRAYLETQQEVLRSIVDSAKFLSPSRSSRAAAAAAASTTSAARGGAAGPAGRRSVGGSGAAAGARDAGTAAASGKTATIAGARRSTTPGGAATAAAGRAGGAGEAALASSRRGGSVWGGALGSSSGRGVAAMGARGAGRTAAAAKGPSAETLRVMGEKLFASAVEKLQQQFSQKYRIATLVGAAHALEDLEVKTEPCWLAKLLLRVDAATGIFVHHHVISYMLLFLPTVSYVRLQQCSSLTYRAVETDLNRRLYRLPLQTVPQRTDISYFYHVVRFFFHDGVRLLPIDRFRYRPTQQALAAANLLLPVCSSDCRAHLYVSLDALSHDMISSPDAEQPLPHLWRKNKAQAGALGKSTSQEISLLQFIEEYKMRAQVRKDDLVWQQPVDGVDVLLVSVLLQHLLKTLTDTVVRHHGQCFFRRTEYLMNNDVQIFHRIWLQCNLHWGGKLEDPGSMKRLHFTVADNFRWEG